MGCHEGVDAASHEGNEAVPGFEMGDRKGRPYAGLVAELFGCERLVYETR